MAASRTFHGELDELRAELRKPAAPASRRRTHADPPHAELRKEAETESVGAPEPSAMAALEEQLTELGKALSEYSGSTEDFIAKHPLASVLAAFMLGVAVARLVGRS